PGAGDRRRRSRGDGQVVPATTWVHRPPPLHAVVVGSQGNGDRDAAERGYAATPAGDGEARRGERLPAPRRARRSERRPYNGGTAPRREALPHTDRVPPLEDAAAQPGRRSAPPARRDGVQRHARTAHGRPDAPLAEGAVRVGLRRLLERSV